MRIFATGNKDADSSAVKESRFKGSSWSEGYRCALVLAIIMALGFALRIVFAYGISAADGYALSGGTNASSHLRVILEILAGTYNPGDQVQLNYPYGIASSSGPFYDYMMAAFAAIGGAFGVSNSVAAAGAMAWTSPIFSVLTAIPVFVLAKKVTKDGTIALLSAFIFTFTALVISVTPFSYGGEFALLGLLTTSMACVLVTAFQTADEAKMAGFKSIKDKRILLPTLAAGALYGLSALTWSEFRVIPLVAAVILAIHLIICRVKGRDIGVSAAITTVFLAVGTIIAAIYYIPSGLWTTVFMGGCMLTVFTIIYTLLFVFAERKPWVITIPCFLIAIIVVAVLLNFLVPDMSRAMFHNANLFADGLVRNISEMFTRSSISSMATWFGWITVWCPLFLGAYFLYRYKKNSGTRMYDLAVFGLLSMFFICWFTTGNAILAAPAMAISTAYLLVVIIRKVGMREYFSSLKTLRGSGLKGGAKKVFNFFPFVTLVVVVALVVAPNAISAFDAATPTNDEKSGYFGGIGYTINTSDVSVVGNTWNDYSDVSKDGALLTWYGYSDAASVFGDFDVVTSPYGNAAQTMSVALMQSGSAGAVVAMTVRLLEQKSSDVIKAAVSVEPTVDAAEFEKILKDPKYAETTLADTDFAKLKLDDGLREYYGIFNYLHNTLHLNESELAAIYDKTCQVTGDKISYIQVDSTMLPLGYGDGNSFSTIAYLGGYNVDSSGGVDGYYMMYNSLGYAYYYDAMYTTFAYQALFGCSPSYYGVGNSISYLSSLGSSNGDIKPLPGYGLAGFEVEYWHVMYNADEKATGTSDGWVNMDAHEAIEKQAKDGGVINYLRSSVVMKYVGVGNSVFSGTVKNDAGVPIPDVTVNVYANLDGFDPSEKIGDVLYSTCITDADGNYSVALPIKGNEFYTGGYTIVYSTSAKALADGNVFLSVAGDQNNKPAADVRIDDSVIDDQTIVGADGETLRNFNGTIRIVHSDGVTEREAHIYDGVFDFGTEANGYILPGTYKATVYETDGAVLFTADLTVVPGTMKGITLKATTYKLTVTVNDMFSNPIGDVKVRVYTEDGDYIGPITTAADDTDDAKKGVGTINLIPGKYTCIVDQAGLYATTTAQVEITSSEKSVTLSCIRSVAITEVQFPGLSENPGVPVTIRSSAFTTQIPNSKENVYAEIPAAYGYIGLDNYVVSAYVNGELYEGQVSFVGGNYVATLSKTDSVTISGTVFKADGTAAAGAIVVLDSENDYHKVTADENGKYSFPATKGASVTLMAYTSDFAVKYFTKTVENQDMTVDFNLGNGAEKTFTVYYYTGLTTSTKTVPFYGDFTATLSIDGGDVFTVTNVITDASGKARFVVPEGYTVSMKIGPTNTDYFYIGDKKDGAEVALERSISASSSSETLYIQYNQSESSSTSYGTSYLKPQVAKFDDIVDKDVPSTSLNGKLKPYKTITDVTEYTIVAGVINNGQAINPGSYTMELEGDYHYDKNAYVTFYPGEGVPMVAKLEKKVFEYYTVTAKGSSGDTYSIVTDGEYSYVDSNDNSRVYYIEKGEEATIGATAEDGKAAFATVSDDADLDLTSKYELVTLSGNINVNSATGTVSVAYFDNDSGKFWSFTADVSSGKYTFKVPGAPIGVDAFEYTVSVDLKSTGGDGETYYYTVVDTPSVKVGDKDVTFNFGVYTNNVEEEDAEYGYLNYAEMGLDPDTGTFMGTVDLTLLDSSAEGSVQGGSFYLIDGSDGFFLDETYSVFVPAGTQGSPLRVIGTFNPFKNGAGSDAIAVNIKSVDGTVLKTISIPAKYFDIDPIGAQPKAELEVAGEDSETYDSVNGYSYTYSIGIKNPNNSGIIASVKASVPAGSDWTVFVSFDGYNVYPDAYAQEGYVIEGYGSATASITIVSPTSFGYDKIPAITYNVTLTDMDGLEIKDIKGASATGTLEHKTGSVSESSSSVSGADNTPKKISTAFYILLVLSVLVLLAFVYSANKRGVFSRK